MFPGLTTKVSESELAVATTIYPKTDVVYLSDTTSMTILHTITPAFGGGFSGIHILVNQTGGNITTTTAGNIATAVTIGQNVAILLVYSKLKNEFYVGALA